MAAAKDWGVMFYFCISFYFIMFNTYSSATLTHSIIFSSENLSIQTLPRLHVTILKSFLKQNCAWTTTQKPWVNIVSLLIIVRSVPSVLIFSRWRRIKLCNICPSTVKIIFIILLVNGKINSTDFANLSRVDIGKKLFALKGFSGAQANFFKSRTFTRTPSSQGNWNPFLFKWEVIL